MKKFTKLASLALAAALSLSLMSCSQTTTSSTTTADASSTTESADNAAIGPLLVAGGSSGGNGFVAATALIEKVKENHPNSSIDVVPGSTAANILKLWQGDAELIFATTSTMMKASKGMYFSDECDEAVDVLAVADLWDQYFQFTVSTSFPYDSIDDAIINQYAFSVSAGPKGNAGADALEEYLSVCYDLTLSDLESWGCTIVYCDFTDATQMMMDGQLDMFAPLTAAPASSIMELALSVDLKWLSVSDESAEKLADLGYVSAVMPAGYYSGQDEDVNTISLPYGIGASATMSDYDVYAFTKALCENEDYLKDSISALENFDCTTAFTQMNFDLHPGAAQYYTEMGWMD